MTQPDLGSAAYADGAVGSSTLETLESAQRYNDWVCSHLAPYLGRRNLEIGAGRGTLTEIIARSHDVIPVDVSAHNVQALERRFRGHPRVREPLASFLEHEEAASLDAVYSANVLEHVEDDLQLLEHAAHVLTPGGCFVAWVPAGMWLYSAFDRSIGHHRRYTAKDRGRILEFTRQKRLPLTLATYRFYNPVGALGWFVNMRCRKRASINEGDARLMDALIGWLRPLDSLRLPFGQSALIVLRRS